MSAIAVFKDAWKNRDKMGDDKQSRELAAFLPAALEIQQAPPNPIAKWLGTLPGQPHIVLQTNETDLRLAAIKAGLGMGFLNDGAAHADLIEIMPPLPEWGFTVWMVTHVDLHRTPKVQAATSAIRKTLRR